MVDPPQLGTLTITKKDAVTKEPVTGAEFTVTGTSSYHGNFTLKSVDNGDGTYTISNIPVTAANGDDYTVSETKAPKGYVLSTATKSFKFTRDGQPETWEMEDTPTTALQIRKLASDTNAGLPGASFKLENVNDASESYTKSSGNGGTLSFSGLVAGATYRLTEESAPEQYIKDNSEWRVTVSSRDGTLSVTKGGSADPNYANGVLTITNERSAVALTVKKTLTDTSITTSFPFTLRIEGSNLSNVTVTVKNANGAAVGTARTFNANAAKTAIDASFSLAHGQTATIDGVPIGAKAILTETNYDGFRVLIKEGNRDLASSNTYTINSVTEARNLEVVNNAGTALPHTGGSGTLLNTFFGLGIMAATLVCGLTRRRRERRFEA